MTYGRLLLQFVVVPIIVLAVLVLRDRRKRNGGTTPPGRLAYVMVAALIVVAVLYTTPWDNHLIATGVWWYRPELVSGITFGWIPLEELLFFPLQTLLVGLWFLWLVPRLAHPAVAGGDTNDTAYAGAGIRMRLIASVAGGCLWLVALSVLLVGWRPGTYAGWELAWALPPLILQLGLGADILWRYRRLVAATLVPVILYLSTVDALAIHEGIWTIDPRQSLGILLGGLLPLEELLFFSLTSALVAFGLVLGVAAESRARLRAYYAFLAYALARRSGEREKRYRVVRARDTGLDA